MNIRNLRLKKGWTQQALANKLGVSQQTIAKWENQKGLPKVDKLPIIAKIFCVRIEELYDEHNQKQYQKMEEIINDEQTKKRSRL